MTAMPPGDDDLAGRPQAGGAADDRGRPASPARLAADAAGKQSQVRQLAQRGAAGPELAGLRRECAAPSALRRCQGQRGPAYATGLAGAQNTQIRTASALTGIEPDIRAQARISAQTRDG